MSTKTPEEIAALKAKYSDKSAEKEAAKAAKKAKYAEINAEKNMKTYEVRIPMYWGDEPSNGPIRNKYIDLEEEHYKSWVDNLVRIEIISEAMRKYGTAWIYYIDNMGPYKVKVVRT